MVVSMNALIMSLLLANSAPGAVPAKQLTPVILKIAKKYNQDALLIAQIILLESRGRSNAYNSATQDYGIMQINIKTAASMHLDTACLFNWKCNLDAGVKILSKMNRVCRYNVGTGNLIGKRLRSCLTYESKLASMGVMEGITNE